MKNTFKSMGRKIKGLFLILFGQSSIESVNSAKEEKPINNILPPLELQKTVSSSSPIRSYDIVIPFHSDIINPCGELVSTSTKIGKELSLKLNSEMNLSKAMKILGTDKLYESENYYIYYDNGEKGSQLAFTFKKDNVFLHTLIQDDNFIKSMGLSYIGHASYMYGDFWKSGKETNCFIPKNDGEDILIIIDWHRNSSSDEYIGISKDLNIDAINALYFHRTKSSGILTGSDYIVVPKDYSRKKLDKDI